MVSVEEGGHLCAMSRLNVLPSKSTLSTAAYTASSASFKVGACAETAITRPPEVLIRSPDWTVPEWKTTVSERYK